MGEEDKDSSVEASLAIDPISGKLEASAKVSGVVRLFRALFPGFTARGRIKHVMVDNIERQLQDGKSLADLTKGEQQLVAVAHLSELRKAANREQILDRAAEIEPKVRGLFEAQEADVPIKALPPTSNPREQSDPCEQSEEAADEQQYFWERFWADAEVVSVEYIQDIYAKILAGKVRSPGWFSLRTLDTIRCLDERTAKLFSEVCQYAIGDFLVPEIFGSNRLFSVLELNTLDDAGLLRTDKLATAIEPHNYSYEPWLIRIKSDMWMPSGVHPFTAAGRELLRLIPMGRTTERAIEVCRALATGLRGMGPCEVCKRPGDSWVEWQEHFGIALPSRGSEES